MNNEERTWLNNQLFQFYDERYGTDGNFTAFASLSTADNRDFSPLRLCLSVGTGNSDYNRKTCWLSFTQVNELIFTIEDIIKPENLDYIYNKGHNLDIERRYSKKIFRMFFKKSKDLNDCVLLGIYANENDRNITILTYDYFRTFYSILKQFRDNYFLIENMMIDRYLKSIELEEIKSMNNNFKSFSKMFEEFQELFENKISSINNSNHNNFENNNYGRFDKNDEIEEDEKNHEDSGLVNDFDEFMNNNINNINIPEVESVENEITNKDNNKNNINENLDNDFINKILKNDINNLYTKTKNIILEDSKILSFNQLFKNELGIDLLENVDEKSLKSCIYLSELNIRQCTKQYYFYGKDYPRTCNLIRSDIKEYDQFNKDLAYSLFMIHAYMKNYSERMEYKTNDQLASKTDFYINLRLFSDIFTYSILINEKPEVIKNRIKSIFNYFKENKFFETFDNELEDYNSNPVTIDDILKFVDNVTDKLPKTKNSIDLQNELYENKLVKLPSENKFTIEQIIKQIVNLEVLNNFKLDIDDNAEKFGIDLNSINKDILLIFKENKKVNKQKEKQTNLYRYIKYYDDEIPDKLKDSFYDHIKQIQYDNFDFVNSKFPLSEFGEDIIKGLYQWNNLENKKEKYSDFFYKCSETILNKNDILTREMETTEEESDDNEETWDELIK